MPSRPIGYVAIAGAVGGVFVSVGVALANDYCGRCVDICIGRAGGGCEVYFATPDVWTRVTCPPGTSNSTPCSIDATVGCYTTYRICTEGNCSGAICQDEGGCATYLYPYVDAAPTFSGPTQCS